ncbi:MAG: hypothetical protein M1818_006168 [Claussenomyces sp. TS43310]|nr:MAG: hypothetical protein M1818_006168 [Claussenomyces sp. TS43310]
MDHTPNSSLSPANAESKPTLDIHYTTEQVSALRLEQSSTVTEVVVTSNVVENPEQRNGLVEPGDEAEEIADANANTAKEDGTLPETAESTTDKRMTTPKDDTEPQQADEVPEKKQKKKKKKKKSSGKNKKPPISGFEEGYCEMPMTPDDYFEEAHDLYHRSRSFVERIEQCIQRYRARRKLDEKRSNVFTKYLTLGGVYTGVKAFGGGLDKETIEDSTAAEIATLRATDYIRTTMDQTKFYNPLDSENWVIDFEGIVKGFLSHKAPRSLGIDCEKTIEQYCGVIRNFIQYVIAHSVCPEYEDNLRAARNICDLAEKELCAIKRVGEGMPGDFNTAASTLYGGYYEDLCVDELAWTTDITEMPGMSKRDAERIFRTAIAHMGSNQQFTAMMDCNQMPRVTEVRVRSFEVVDIILPSNEVKRQFSGTKDVNGYTGNIIALGILRVKRWTNPEAEDEDMTDEDEAAPAGGNVVEHANEDFWLEENVLEACFIGMKFECAVRELDIGVKYFDSIMGIYCSFFTFLPNEMMSEWVVPRPNERPPPMVGDSENAKSAVDV